MSDERLQKLVDETIAWANDLVKTWVGTRTGNIINSQKKHVEYLKDSKEYNLLSVAILELAQTCDYADKVG